MNTEEVVQMIDAITEGHYYARIFETTPDSSSISIEVGTNHPELNKKAAGEFWFSSFDEGSQFLAKINDPRTAREIAGALVAWANRKEGKVIENADPSKWDMLSKPGQRAEWYERNIKRMSQEAKNQNLKDLRHILSGTSGKAEDEDIRAAIQILRDAGAE